MIGRRTVLVGLGFAFVAGCSGRASRCIPRADDDLFTYVDCKVTRGYEKVLEGERGHVSSLRNQIYTQQKTILRLEESIRDVNREIDRQQNRLREIRADIRQLERLSRNLEAHREEIRTLITKVKQKLRYLQKGVQNLTERADQLAKNPNLSPARQRAWSCVARRGRSTSRQILDFLQDAFVPDSYAEWALFLGSLISSVLGLTSRVAKLLKWANLLSTLKSGIEAWMKRRECY